MNIGKAIKELRKQKLLSQDELAEQAGITQAALSHIERGKRPGESTLEKLSAALGVSVSLIYMLSIDEADVPPENADVYQKLFPHIQQLILGLAKKPPGEAAELPTDQ